MLTLLLERHPDGSNLIHRTNSLGCTVLHQICALEVEEAGEMLEMVIELGADVHQLTNDGESALFYARSCAVLDVLMKHNLQLDLVSNAGETPLQRVLGNAPSVAKFLYPLVRELPSFRDHAHKYLIAMASCCTRSFFNFHYRDLLDRYPETTKLMFDSLYERCPEEASKLFAEACSRALNYVVEKFIDFDYALNYNYQGKFLNNPLAGLLSYMEEPNLIFVQRLLEKNIDLNVQNSFGQTALQLFVKNFSKAKLRGYGTATVELLISKGSLVNTRDVKGNTALHFAYRQRDWDLVEVLIRNGADSGIENRKGKTPVKELSAVDQELFYFWS
uniref:Ankyrin repeat protein L92 n=2 Tax=Culex pipiens TaxID=7175 RepID=A0A8D8L6Z4_CULPI